MDEICHLDYETRSVISLDERGLDNYVRDPSTQVLLAAYAFGDHKPKLWQPHLQPEMPADLREALESPWVQIHAWNAAFERAITHHVLCINKPIEDFRDPMCMARYLSLPGSLDAAGEILGLKESEAKLKEGKRLLRLFTEPEDPGGTPNLFGTSKPSFRDWRTDPADWKLFCDYVVRDVIAERAAEKKLKKFPLPDFEWETWFLSEAINSRGWPVSMDLVRGARAIVDKELGILNAHLLELIKLANPGSVNQLLPWLRGRGYTFSSVDKTFVARALAGECELTEEAKEVLILRGQTSKSSVRKYTNIADMVSPDGRLRHQYTFMGAARTGRFAAHGVNVGNLPKPDKTVEKNLPRAIELVRLMDYDSIKREFGRPLDVVGSTVRAAFRAPDGFKFAVSDLASIENVGAGFISRSDPVMRVFREGRDPYLDFGTYFYGIPYEVLWAEYKAGDKSKRNFCKPATLGAGFGLGPGEEKLDEDGNIVRTGLLAYAFAMGVTMTREEAVKVIKIFRKVYPEIPQTWKDLERAAIRAVKNPGQLIGVGVPQSEKEKDWFLSKGRAIDVEPIISFLGHGKKVLELMLPSGRSLHYIDPEIHEDDYVWEGQKLKSEKITYYGKEQDSTHWGRVPTFGGKLFENSDQAWARDILVNGMHEADREGFEIVGSTYDELITLISETSIRLSSDFLCECMTRKPHWMPDGIPLRAEGSETKEYGKN